MKKIAALYASAILISLTLQTAKATVNFADDFNSYANGNLAGLTQDTAGQGPWKQTSTSAATPVQVNNGSVVLGTSGQDVYAALTTPIAITTGSTFYIGASIDLTAAQASGDYFLNFTPTVGNTTSFPERLYAKSVTGGFVFGYNPSSNGTIDYSTSVLSFNTSYNVILAYTGVAGPTDDTFALYVNPADTSVEGNNTAYLTSGYIGTTAESTTVAGINLRQGSATAAPSVILDDLRVGTTFGEISTFPVPEPGTLTLAVLGGLGCMFAFRRRR